MWNIRLTFSPVKVRATLGRRWWARTWFNVSQTGKAQLNLQQGPFFSPIAWIYMQICCLCLWLHSNWSYERLLIGNHFDFYRAYKGIWYSRSTLANVIEQLPVQTEAGKRRLFYNGPWSCGDLQVRLHLDSFISLMSFFLQHGIKKSECFFPFKSVDPKELRTNIESWWSGLPSQP